MQAQIIDEFGQKFIICITALSLSMGPIFIMLSTKTKELAFVGDNSLRSVLKVLFSRNFSREVKSLSVRAQEDRLGEF
jgi:hypothetical protein